MKTVSSVWIEPSDTDFDRAVRLIGIRECARSADINASFLCRWLKGETGMSVEKFKRLSDSVAKGLLK